MPTRISGGKVLQESRSCGVLMGFLGLLRSGGRGQGPGFRSREVKSSPAVVGLCWGRGEFFVSRADLLIFKFSLERGLVCGRENVSTLFVQRSKIADRPFRMLFDWFFLQD